MLLWQSASRRKRRTKRDIFEMLVIRPDTWQHVLKWWEALEEQAFTYRCLRIWNMSDITIALFSVLNGNSHHLWYINNLSPALFLWHTHTLKSLPLSSSVTPTHILLWFLFSPLLWYLRTADFFEDKQGPPLSLPRCMSVWHPFCGSVYIFEAVNVRTYDHDNAYLVTICQEIVLRNAL